MADYSLDDLAQDFPTLSGKCHADIDGSSDVSSKDIVVAVVQYKMWDDYCRDNHGNYVLKSDAVPRGYRIGTNEFKTLEEMFIFIDLNYGRDVEIHVDDCMHSDDIVNAWCNYNKRIVQ